MRIKNSNTCFAHIQYTLSKRLRRPLKHARSGWSQICACAKDIGRAQTNWQTNVHIHIFDIRCKISSLALRRSAIMSIDKTGKFLHSTPNIQDHIHGCHWTDQLLYTVATNIFRSTQQLQGVEPTVTSSSSIASSCTMVMFSWLIFTEDSIISLIKYTCKKSHYVCSSLVSHVIIL